MKQKIITILEANVNEDNWRVLEEAYEEANESQPPRPLQSFLIQSQKDRTLWRIVSVWENMEVLQELRSSGQTPRGVLIFRRAGAEPTLTVFEAKKVLDFT